MSMIPEGFTPLFRSSAFLDLLGPIYNQRIDAGLVIGLRAEAKHCNARGLVHGGVLSSLADVALGYNSAFAEEPPTPLVTSSLTIDYAGTANSATGSASPPMCRKSAKAWRLPIAILSSSRCVLLGRARCSAYFHAESVHRRDSAG